MELGDFSIVVDHKSFSGSFGMKHVLMKYFWRLHLGLILYNVFDVGYLGGFQKVS